MVSLLTIPAGGKRVRVRELYFLNITIGFKRRSSSFDALGLGCSLLLFFSCVLHTSFGELSEVYMLYLLHWFQCRVSVCRWYNLQDVMDRWGSTIEAPTFVPFVPLVLSIHLLLTPQNQDTYKLHLGSPPSLIGADIRYI